MVANGGQASLGTTIAGFTLSHFAHIMSVSGPSVSGTDVDVSELSNVIKQFVPGQVDGGEVTLGLRYTLTQAAAILADMVATSTVELFTITFPDTSDYVFTGYIKGMNLEVPEDGAIDSEVTIKVTGVTDPLIS